MEQFEGTVEGRCPSCGQKDEHWPHTSDTQVAWHEAVVQAHKDGVHEGCNMMTCEGKKEILLEMARIGVDW